MLFTSLPGPRQAAAAMPGLIDALRPGATWVDMTTNDRGLVLELAQRAEARQVRVLDAPVTGAIDGARRGTLTIFVGGSGPVLEQVRPYRRPPRPRRLAQALGRLTLTTISANASGQRS